MPDIKLAIPALVAVAILVGLGVALGWILDNPGKTFLFLAMGGSAFGFVIRRSRQRNRV
ncbi:MAG TPA: hypothetical protein VGH02_04350 [Rhizomicrobium sp.]|jgi:hypothetical protein